MAVQISLFVPRSASALDLAIVAEAFRLRGGTTPTDYRVRFVAEDRRPAATTVPELWLHPARSAVDPLPVMDTLVVLGGDAPEIPSAPALAWLSRAATTARRCAAAGTGVFLLGATGALDDRRVTTASAHADLLASRYPRTIVDTSVEIARDGALLTCAGGASTIAMILELIREDAGAAAAAGAARALTYGSGAGQAAISLDVPDAAILDVIGHVRSDLGGVHNVGDLARRAAMSERSFARAFVKATGMGAAAFVRRERIAQARRLLEGTDLPVNRVLSLSGFATVSAGRRAFEAAEGASPSLYRRRLQAGGIGG